MLGLRSRPERVDGPDATQLQVGPPLAVPTVRYLLASTGELIRSQKTIFAVLAIWTFAPLVALLLYVDHHGGVLTGADVAYAFDQFQYLAWIRDEGSHVLASNLWQIGPTPHDYLHPMWVLSGLLWRLGASIQVAYLAWKPVALLVLFLGFAAYVRHLLPESRLQQMAALFLALFYLSPALTLATWAGHMSFFNQLQLILATDDANSALNLWGVEHTAIAIGLMPVFLIAAAKLIAAPARDGAPAWVWTPAASIAGLLVSWLHPWQGVMLLAIVGGLVVVAPPRRRHLALIAPTVATLLPLIYGVVLSRLDPSWRTFQSESTITGTAPWWALVVSFGPLVAFAVLGLRRPRQDREWMLLLWVLACVGVYFLVPEFPPHALSGVTLPLAILATRGWRRLRLPRYVAAPAAILAILAFTVPAGYKRAQGVADDLSNTVRGAYARALLRLTPDEAAALAYLDHAPRAGAVLAPQLLSMSIPGSTGREVYAGHVDWQPASHGANAGVFFSPTLKDPGGALRRRLLTQTKATFVLADCGGPTTLAADIAPIARPVRRFGCVTVYETN